MFDEPSRLNDLVKRYRRFALDAKLSAATAEGAKRKEFLRIAEHWDQLAAVAEGRVEEKSAETDQR